MCIRDRYCKIGCPHVDFDIKYRPHGLADTGAQIQYGPTADFIGSQFHTFTTGRGVTDGVATYRYTESSGLYDTPYFVRARVFRTANGATVYSNWSATWHKRSPSAPLPNTETAGRIASVTQSATGPNITVTAQCTGGNARHNHFFRFFNAPTGGDILSYNTGTGTTFADNPFSITIDPLTDGTHTHRAFDHTGVYYVSYKCGSAPYSARYAFNWRLDTPTTTVTLPALATFTATVAGSTQARFRWTLPTLPAGTHQPMVKVETSHSGTIVDSQTYPANALSVGSGYLTPGLEYTSVARLTAANADDGPTTSATFRLPIFEGPFGTPNMYTWLPWGHDREGF